MTEEELGEWLEEEKHAMRQERHQDMSGRTSWAPGGRSHEQSGTAAGDI